MRPAMAATTRPNPLFMAISVEDIPAGCYLLQAARRRGRETEEPSTSLGGSFLRCHANMIRQSRAAMTPPTSDLPVDTYVDGQPSTYAFVELM
jgi:hypothetical protein